MKTRPRPLFLTLSLCLTLGLQGVPAAAQQSADKGRRDTSLVEETSRRLGQLDVTVSGPDEAISNLTAEDFSLTVGGTFIESFTVDRSCSTSTRVERTVVVDEAASDDPPQQVELTPEQAAVVAAAAVKPTYLFYFDQHHLTPAGRQNSIDTARSVVDRLIQDGARGMIISAGKTIQTIQGLTDDRDLIQDGLDALEKDNDQWDVWAYQEDDRVNDVLRALMEQQDQNRALSIARQYQREERFRTDKALRLFEISVAQLADFEPPKAVLYFADSMRRNAGAHYTSYFPNPAGDPDPTISSMESDAFIAGNAFQRAIEAASSHGVRLYTVQGEGLAAPSGITSSRAGFGGRGNGSPGQSVGNQRRRIDAQDSLVGLARETGGRAFLHGAPAKKIAESIFQDLSCLYLISFDVSQFPQDKPLSVNLRTSRPKVKAETRGQILFASKEKRNTARLLAAFTGLTSDDAALPLEGVVIPTGFEDGKYSALVQISAPSMPLPSSRWEIGASFVARGRVREDFAGQIDVDKPYVPVIFETEVKFSPGPFELVLVAHEKTTDQIARATLEGDWPDPDGSPVTLAPMAVVQPAEGAFLRAGELRRNGSLGVPSESHVVPDKPAAVIGLVCRDKTKKSRRAGLVVERKLVGESSAPFADLTLSDPDARCVQLRDIIRAGTMTEGNFSYEVRVTNDDQEEVANATFDFSAIDRAATNGI